MSTGVELEYDEPMPMIRSFRLSFFIFIIAVACVAGCTSSSQVTDWRDIPKNQPVSVTTRSGSRFHFTTCTAVGDSLLLGIADSSFYRIYRDSVTNVTTTSRSSFSFVSPVVGAILSLGIVAILIVVASST